MVISRGDNINKEMPTGEIEVEETGYNASASDVLLQIADEDNAPETTRLTYRFGFKKRKLHSNMLRSKVISSTRRRMIEMIS